MFVQIIQSVIWVQTLVHHDIVLLDHRTPAARLALDERRGLGRIVAFCDGFIQGLRTPVDRVSLKYVGVSALRGERRRRRALG